MFSGPGIDDDITNYANGKHNSDAAALTSNEHGDPIPLSAGSTPGGHHSRAIASNFAHASPHQSPAFKLHGLDRSPGTISRAGFASVQSGPADGKEGEDVFVIKVPNGHPLPASALNGLQGPIPMAIPLMAIPPTPVAVLTSSNAEELYRIFQDNWQGPAYEYALSGAPLTYAQISVLQAHRKIAMQAYDRLLNMYAHQAGRCCTKAYRDLQKIIRAIDAIIERSPRNLLEPEMPYGVPLATPYNALSVISFGVNTFPLSIVLDVIRNSWNNLNKKIASSKRLTYTVALLGAGTSLTGLFSLVYGYGGHDKAAAVGGLFTGLLLGSVLGGVLNARQAQVIKDGRPIIYDNVLLAPAQLWDNLTFVFFDLFSSAASGVLAYFGPERIITAFGGVGQIATIMSGIWGGESGITNFISSLRCVNAWPRFLVIFPEFLRKLTDFTRQNLKVGSVLWAMTFISMLALVTLLFTYSYSIVNFFAKRIEILRDLKVYLIAICTAMGLNGKLFSMFFNDFIEWVEKMFLQTEEEKAAERNGELPTNYPRIKLVVTVMWSAFLLSVSGASIFSNGLGFADGFKEIFPKDYELHQDVIKKLALAVGITNIAALFSSPLLTALSTVDMVYYGPGTIFTYLKGKCGGAAAPALEYDEKDNPYSRLANGTGLRHRKGSDSSDGYEKV